MSENQDTKAEKLAAGTYQLEWISNLGKAESQNERTQIVRCVALIVNEDGTFDYKSGEIPHAGTTAGRDNIYFHIIGQPYAAMRDAKNESLWRFGKYDAEKSQLSEVVSEINLTWDGDPEEFTLGKTKAGNPQHPRITASRLVNKFMSDFGLEASSAVGTSTLRSQNANLRDALRRIAAGEDPAAVMSELNLDVKSPDDKRKDAAENRKAAHAAKVAA